MSGKSYELRDLSLNIDGLAKELNLLCAINNGSSGSSYGLISNKQDCALRSPQVVLKMMPDPSCITHSGS